MNKEILNKNVVVENNLVIITENIKTTMDRNQLESKLRDTQMQKMRIQEQNTRLVSEYNKLILEETELNDLISQLNINDGIKEI